MYKNIDPKDLKIDKTLGYVYFIDKLHPLGSKDVGRVYYHRHIASISRNAWVTQDECVHHIDGNKANNLSTNLQVLSLKEHTKLHAIEKGFELINIVCPVCSVIFPISNNVKGKRVCCSVPCAKKHQIIWSISKEELEILIWNMSYSSISKIYNISDVGAKKRAKSLGCKMPPPYFFNKTEKFRQEQRLIYSIPDLSTQQSSKLLA